MQTRDLSDHVAYEAGRGVEEEARERGRDPEEFVKLSSNENPFGPPPAAVEAIRESAAAASQYPKAAHADLRDAIADHWQLASEQVWLANGADGAIDYLSRAFLDPGDDVLVPDPGFAYYGMASRFHHGGVATYDVRADDGFALTAETVRDAYDGERIIYLTSPHNPTGGRFDLEDVVDVASATDEDTLTVVDEAYGEYADAPSAVDLLADRDDVAVLRTFSKAYGLAGVRLGYALVPTAWADAYARVNTPFAASELACRAGAAALTDAEHLDRSVSVAREARAYIRAELEAPTYESAANFVLADVGDAAAVFEAAAQRGVLVRDCTSFGLPGCVRITCGTMPETRRAVEALNDALAEVEP